MTFRSFEFTLVFSNFRWYLEMIAHHKVHIDTKQTKDPTGSQIPLVPADKDTHTHTHTHIDNIAPHFQQRHGSHTFTFIMLCEQTRKEHTHTKHRSSWHCGVQYLRSLLVNQHMSPTATQTFTVCRLGHNLYQMDWILNECIYRLKGI